MVNHGYRLGRAFATPERQSHSAFQYGGWTNRKSVTTGQGSSRKSCDDLVPGQTAYPPTVSSISCPQQHHVRDSHRGRKGPALIPFHARGKENPRPSYIGEYQKRSQSRGLPNTTYDLHMTASKILQTYTCQNVTTCFDEALVSEPWSLFRPFTPSVESHPGIAREARKRIDYLLARR